MGEPISTPWPLPRTSCSVLTEKFPVNGRSSGCHVTESGEGTSTLPPNFERTFGVVPDGF
jgi:hypothetical protein